MSEARDFVEACFDAEELKAHAERQSLAGAYVSRPASEILGLLAAWEIARRDETRERDRAEVTGRALDACRVEHDDAMSAYRAAVARAEAAERRVGELECAVDQALQAPTYEAMEVTLQRLNVPIVLAPEEGADDGL